MLGRTGRRSCGRSAACSATRQHHQQDSARCDPPAEPQLYVPKARQRRKQSQQEHLQPPARPDPTQHTNVPSPKHAGLGAPTKAARTQGHALHGPTPIIQQPSTVAALRRDVQGTGSSGQSRSIEHENFITAADNPHLHTPADGVQPAIPGAAAAQDASPQRRAVRPPAAAMHPSSSPSSSLAMQQDPAAKRCGLLDAPDLDGGNPALLAAETPGGMTGGSTDGGGSSSSSSRSSGCDTPICDIGSSSGGNNIAISGFVSSRSRGSSGSSSGGVPPIDPQQQRAWLQARLAGATSWREVDDLASSLAINSWHVDEVVLLLSTLAQLLESPEQGLRHPDLPEQQQQQQQQQQLGELGQEVEQQQLGELGQQQQQQQQLGELGQEVEQQQLERQPPSAASRRLGPVKRKLVGAAWRVLAWHRRELLSRWEQEPLQALQVAQAAAVLKPPSNGLLTVILHTLLAACLRPSATAVVRTTLADPAAAMWPNESAMPSTDTSASASSSSSSTSSSSTTTTTTATTTTTTSSPVLAEQLVAVARCCAEAGEKPHAHLRDRLLQATTPSLHTLPAPALADLLWCLHVWRHPPPDAWARTALERLQADAASLDLRRIITTISAAACLDLHPDEDHLEILANHSTPLLGSALRADLLQLLEALAAIEYTPNAAWRDLCLRRCEILRRDLTLARDVAREALLLGSLGIKAPARWCTQLLSSFLESEQRTATAAAELLWGLQALVAAPRVWVAANLRDLERLVDAAGARLRLCSPLDLMRLIAACANLGFHPGRKFVAWHQAACIRQSHEFPAQLLFEVRAAYRGLNANPEPQLRDMFDRCRLKVMAARNKQLLPSQVRFAAGQAMRAHKNAVGHRQPTGGS